MSTQPVPTPQSFYRPKYRMEPVGKEDCAAFRRNTLRYCFNHQEELRAKAERDRLEGRITGIDYAVRIAFSNSHINKLRELLTKYLPENERAELAAELEQ